MSHRKNQTAALEEKQSGEMGKWAPYYDHLMKVMTLGREKKLREMTISLSQIKPGDSVLEIGCGTGTLTLAAKKRVGPSGEVAAIDLAPEMVAKASQKAKRKGEAVSIQEGNISKIPFPDNRFNVVMCSFMIFHMPEEVRRKGIAEIYRVLKSGGHLFVLDSAYLDGLVSELQENAYAGIEQGNTKFMYLGLSYLRANVVK